jgi:pimeloyl-ACP methyl ester carboxylesterase
MAHGFGAEMSFGLPAFAETFAKNKFAVLTFDYRYFGVSDGLPRQLISTKEQLKDWDSAVEFVRGLDEVDGNNICIWGSSYSGGHVLVTSAKKTYIKAFIANVPYMDSVAFMKKSTFRDTMKVTAAAYKDIFNSITRRHPHNIAIVGRHDDVAILKTPECYDGYLKIVPENTEWKNEFPARSVFNFLWYRPVKYIPEIKCRGLVVFAENDSLTDAPMVEKAFSKKPDIELQKLQCGHFNIYEGEYFKKAVAEEVRFLKDVFS